MSWNIWIYIQRLQFFECGKFGIQLNQNQENKFMSLPLYSGHVIDNYIYVWLESQEDASGQIQKKSFFEQES